MACFAVGVACLIYTANSAFDSHRAVVSGPESTRSATLQLSGKPTISGKWNAHSPDIMEFGVSPSAFDWMTAQRSAHQSLFWAMVFSEFSAFGRSPFRGWSGLCSECLFKAGGLSPDRSKDLGI